jgi:hypothetical protein
MATKHKFIPARASLRGELAEISVRGNIYFAPVSVSILKPMLCPAKRAALSSRLHDAANTDDMTGFL